MRIAITGGSGFLGSALARRWVAEGHEVTLLLRPASSIERVANVASRLCIERCDTDTSLAQALARAKPSMLVHAACSYGRTGESPLQTFDANVRHGVVLLNALLAGSSKPTAFINAGSVLPAAVSFYALGKQQFSQWGAMLAEQSPQQLQFVDVRLQHMYGPHDDAAKFTTHVIRACQRNEVRLALTAGEQQRDFVYIEDVVDAFDCIRERLRSLAPADVVDLGSGDAPTVRHFVETVRDVTGSSTQLDFGALAYRPNEALYCRADVTRLRQWGWQPRHSLTNGIRATLQLESTP